MFLASRLATLWTEDIISFGAILTYYPIISPLTAIFARIIRVSVKRGLRTPAWKSPGSLYQISPGCEAPPGRSLPFQREAKKKMNTRVAGRSGSPRGGGCWRRAPGLPPWLPPRVSSARCRRKNPVPPAWIYRGKREEAMNAIDSDLHFIGSWNSSSSIPERAVMNSSSSIPERAVVDSSRLLPSSSACGTKQTSWPI